MRKRERENWNGKPVLSNVKSQARRYMGITRKLQEVLQALDPMATQKDLTCFLNDPENARKLNWLVEDIRDALMGYQVCTPSGFTSIESNIYHRLHYNKISMTRAVSQL